MFLGDDFHHNGAFRLSYGFEYATMMETSKDQPRFEFDKYDTYEWYLRLGALSNVNEKFPERQNSHLERFRRSSQLRRILASPGDGGISEEGKRADAHGRGLVGSGGLLRSDQDLRDARTE